MMYYGPYSDNLSTFTLLKQIAQIPQNLLLARVNATVVVPILARRALEHVGSRRDFATQNAVHTLGRAARTASVLKARICLADFLHYLRAAPHWLHFSSQFKCNAPVVVPVLARTALDHVGSRRDFATRDAMHCSVELTWCRLLHTGCWWLLADSG